MVAELIGRSDELLRLRELALSTPLVTITGTGGVGKSALATAVIAELCDEYPGGISVVDLTATDHADGVFELVASRLGSTNFESLTKSSICNEALIVLDNCEHVLETSARAVVDLLGMSQPPSIIATSRVSLELPTEAIVALEPLALVPAIDDDGTDPEALQLFLLRARNQGVFLDEEDLASAMAICEQLDGLPLALEIAAARLRVLSAEELRTELESEPHGLARPRYRGSARQRSVQEMVRWSVDLLDPLVADTFRSLSVFTGPFTAQMAAALTEKSATETRRNLDELVAASLVTADPRAGVSWYRLLLPVRSVMRHDLALAQELQPRQSRWVDVVVDLVFDVINKPADGWSEEHLGALLGLYPNITAALRWLIEHEPDDVHRQLKLIKALWGVVHQRHASEIATLALQVTQVDGAEANRHWPGAMATLATCRYLLGDHDHAIVFAERALMHPEAAGFSMIALRRVQAYTALSIADLPAGIALLEEAEALALESGLVGLRLELRCDRGAATARLGDPETGLALIEDAEKEALEHGASVNIALAMLCRGQILSEQQPKAGLALLRETLAASRRASYVAGVVVSLRSIALTQLDQGDQVDAAKTLASLLDELTSRGEFADLRLVLDLAASLGEQVSDPSWADLALTAQSLPVTSGSVRRHLVLFDRAKAAGGRCLQVGDAVRECHRVLRLIMAKHDQTGRDETLRPDSTGHLLREGSVWQVSLGAEHGVATDSKGLRDIAALISDPNREIAAFDLMGSAVVTSSRENLIDVQARRDIEQRIRDLHSQMEEAHDHNDLGRAEHVQAELDALVEHLSKALGLGGRHRAVSTEAERARSAVTHRIRSTIRKIDEAHPNLAKHLRASITTGVFCSYQPDREISWTIRP